MTDCGYNDGIEPMSKDEKKKRSHNYEKWDRTQYPLQDTSTKKPFESSCQDRRKVNGIDITGTFKKKEKDTRRQWISKNAEVELRCARTSVNE